MIPQRGFNLADYAWFWPGVGATIVLAALGASLVARVIHRPWLHGFGLIFSVGIIVSATLTPSYDALTFGIAGSGTCDLSHLGPSSWRDLIRLTDTALNVLLFVPLGLVVGTARSRRQFTALLLAGIAFPIVIEAIQLVFVPLGRACQAADVIDNEAGLLIGVAAGLVPVVIRWLAPPAEKPPASEPPRDQRSAT